MRDSARWVPAYVVVLLVAAGLAGSLSQGDAAPIQAKLVSSERDTVPNIIGEWVGAWEDTIFVGYSGTLEWTIVQDRQDMSATGTIGMGDFGMGDKSGTASGTLTGSPPGQVLSFTFQGDTVGSGEGTIIGGGIVSGTGNVTPPLDFGEFTFQGTVTENTMRGTFDFTFGGAGKASLTKSTPVEATSWGEIKARFRDGE